MEILTNFFFTFDLSYIFYNINVMLYDPLII